MDTPGKISDKRRCSGAVKGGFTLFEILVAVGILGIAFVVIMRGYVVTMKGLERSSSEMTAFMLAENLLAEYEIEGDFSPGDDTGEFEGGPEGFAWKRSVAPLSREDLMFEGVLRVEIFVQSRGGGGVRLVTFVEDSG